MKHPNINLRLRRHADIAHCYRILLAETTGSFRCAQYPPLCICVLPREGDTISNAANSGASGRDWLLSTGREPALPKVQLKLVGSRVRTPDV